MGVTLAFRPLDEPLGAFVEGFDPSTPIDDEMQAALLSALAEYAVLIVRGSALDAAAFVRLGQAFGELEILPEPDKRHPDHPEIFNLTNVGPDGEIVQFEDPQAVFLRGTQRWHTDSSFRDVPCLCTMLHAVEVPPAGGQTRFADMRKAFTLLPEEQRREYSEYTVVHSYEYSRANNPGRMDPMTPDELAKYPPVEHPLVRRHPNGDRSLYLGGHASHIVELEIDKGRALLAEVVATTTVHDIVYEHQWQAGDLVIWDNRTTLHRLLPYDIANERRVMQRLTVAGTERPVS